MSRRKMMKKDFEKYLNWMTPAFSRVLTYHWFIIVCAGFITRSDFLGITSIIRALNLVEKCYVKLLHFFHSTAWSAKSFMQRWQLQLVKHKEKVIVGDRVVFTGDHTKTPKDGRKVPAVSTLHQNSETGSKPSFFRGHHWGALAILFKAGKKYFSSPLEANIQEGKAGSENREKIPKTIKIVQMAQAIAENINQKAYLVLDAYFAVGPVFETAAKNIIDGIPLIHIITRAKKNVVAYRRAPKPKIKKRGPNKKYGKKLKLMKIFDSKAKCYNWKWADTNIYGKKENIRYLVLDLLWKPTKGLVRFVLVESSRGRIILMSSDLNIDPIALLEMYSCRVTIETMFDVQKNVLGGMGYHFWSSYLEPASRKPKKNKKVKQKTSNQKATTNTLSAIEKFVNLQLFLLGMLQLIAKEYPKEVVKTAHCWFRTRSSFIPSEFETRIALGNMIKYNLCGFGKSLIKGLIKKHQNNPRKKGKKRKSA